MRLACLVAVLLVGSAWQCSADVYSKPEPVWGPIEQPEATKLEPLRVAETAQKAVVLAESTNKLAADAAKRVTELHARAETAAIVTKKTAAEAETIAKNTETFAAQKALQNAKMAAEIAQELYEEETTNPTLIEEYTTWFKERREKVSKLEPTLSAAIKALDENRPESDMARLVKDVLSPARRIFKLAQNAVNDARYVAQKLVYTELLAERVEVLQDLAQKAKESAEDKKPDTEESCTNKHHLKNPTEVLHHRQSAAKAYLHAFAAQEIVAKCIPRISANTARVTEMYHKIKGSLAKVKEADHKKMRLYHSIADEARANADESKRVAASTSDNAAMYMDEARNAVNNITLCVSEKEARWYARVAHRASKKALDEMHLAMYQLLAATVSLQQMTDAQLAVKNISSKSGTAETNSAITGPKEKAIDSEKKAEELYTRIKTHEDQAADKLYRLEEMVRQMRRFTALHGSKNAAATVEERLQTAKTAARAARVFSKQAQSAASSVYEQYNKTKAAADSALGTFVQADVEAFGNAATKASIATRESEEINEPNAEEALRKVTQQEKRALKAYEEAQHVIAKAHKATRRAE